MQVQKIKFHNFTLGKVPLYYFLSKYFSDTLFNAP